MVEAEVWKEASPIHVAEFGEGQWANRTPLLFFGGSASFYRFELEGSGLRPRWANTGENRRDFIIAVEVAT